MSVKAGTKELRFDLLKWLLVAVLAVIATIGNQYFSIQPILYRVFGVLVLAVIAAFLALQTAKGQALFSSAKEARVEVRKVVWSSHQETTQTILIVVAVVLVMALLLRGLDSLPGWLVSMIVGQGCVVAKRWYVVHAYSGYEKHVIRSLIKRVELAGMEEEFGEILVPAEEVVEMRNGQKRKSERKLFSGYVLVQMEMNKGT